MSEARILDATKRCIERWGFEKVTVEDIAAEAGVSRATLYRLFPGGKDILFEAMRVRELDDFFATISAAVAGASSIEDLLVRLVVVATSELRADQHLAMMLATEPGETLGQLTAAGFPRIVRVASTYLTPLIARHVSDHDAARLIDVLARATISYFLAPSDHVDLGDPVSTRTFIHPLLSMLASASPVAQSI